MSNYITSGTLTNYVNITGNQTITGKKTLTGGINTKSQTVSGATELNDDMLSGVVKVAGSGNIRLPSPVDNAGGRISFYFESDSQLSTPSGVFSGTIASGGSALLKLLLHHLDGIWKLTPTERTGLSCVVQAILHLLQLRV